MEGGSGMPRVTHLLFVAAFIYADYLCFIQDSSAAFVLTSRGMAVSPFFPDVHPLALHVQPSRKRIVSAPVSCFSADALWHHGSVMMGGVSSV